MSNNKDRDLRHATWLEIARELIDACWQDAEGCVIDEGELRRITFALRTLEKQLRDGARRKPRTDKGARRSLIQQGVSFPA